MLVSETKGSASITVVGIYATKAISHNNRHNFPSEAKIPATVLLARHRTVGERKLRIWVAAKG